MNRAVFSPGCWDYQINPPWPVPFTSKLLSISFSIISFGAEGESHAFEGKESVLARTKEEGKERSGERSQGEYNLNTWRTLPGFLKVKAAQSRPHLCQCVHLLLAKPFGFVHVGQTVLKPPWRVVHRWNMQEKPHTQQGLVPGLSNRKLLVRHQVARSQCSPLTLHCCHVGLQVFVQFGAFSLRGETQESLSF